MTLPDEPEQAGPVLSEQHLHASTLFDLRGTYVFPDEQELQPTHSVHNYHAVPLNRDYLMVHTGVAVTLHHLPTQTRLWTIACPSFNFAFHYQRQLLVLAPGDPAMALLVWDLRTGQILHRLTYEQDGRLSAVDLRGLAFSPDGGVLAVGMEGDIVLWDTTNGRLLQTLQTECFDIYTITFHPTMKLLAAGSFNQLEIWIWELLAGHLLHRWEEPEAFMEDEREREPDRPYQVAFTPDGKFLLASCGEGGLRVWDVEQACEVPGPDTDLHALFLTLAPDGQLVAVSDEGRVVQVFEIGTWRLLHEFGGSYPSESFSPDGQVLATLHEFGDVSVWEVMTGKLLYQVWTSSNDQAPPYLGKPNITT